MHWWIVGVFGAGVAVLFGVMGLAGDATGKLPRSQQVLIVSAARVPLTATAVATLLARGSSDDRPISVEIRHLRPGQTEQDYAKEVGPSLGSFDAVFATELYLARALQMQNAKVPIVFDGVADAVGLCLVDSLRRPGRNATGYMHVLADEEEKQVEVLLAGFPETKRIHYLLSGLNVMPTSCNADDPAWGELTGICVAGAELPMSSLQRLANVDRIARKAHELGVEVAFFVLCDQSDLAKLTALASQRSSAAFIVPWHQLFVEHADELVGTLGRTRRPVLYGRHRFAEGGGVLSMEPTVDPQDHLASVNMLLQVLGGRAPSDLPVQTPRGFSIKLNAGAAASQGLTPTLALVRRADEVMQRAMPK